METECGFPPVFNQDLEWYVKELNEEFDFFKRRIRCTFPVAHNITELDRHYIALLRGVISVRKSVDVTTIFSIFIATKDLVQFYKSRRHGDFAMALCFWLKDFLADCEIDWDQPRNTRFYQLNRISRWDSVARIFSDYRIKLFDMYYKLLSWF